MFDFSVLLDYSSYLVLAAFIVEIVTEIIKENLPEKVRAQLNADAKRLIALVVSVLLFVVVSPLRPFDNDRYNLLMNLVAVLVVSRGSNFVHDFYKLLRQKIENKQ
jgi:amino acid transporter